MADLTSTLASAGIDANDVDLHLSGFQRLPTEDRPSRRNGAVVVLSVRPLRVWFQNWASGVSGLYAEGGSGLPSRAELNRIMCARRDHREQRELTNAEAAARANEVWRAARPASPDHPYLQRKRVGVHGIRQSDDLLLIPLRATGRLQSLQSIDATGEKCFLAGGAVKGCYHSIGARGGTVIIVEGYATGAALAEALEEPLGVAVALNAGNLKPVAIDIRRRYPRTRIVIGADNDVATPANPGIRYGTEAAAAVGGIVCAPQFSMVALRESLTDWNDYRNRYGDGPLRACFDQVLRDVG